MIILTYNVWWFCFSLTFFQNITVFMYFLHFKLSLVINVIILCSLRVFAGWWDLTKWALDENLFTESPIAGCKNINSGPSPEPWPGLDNAWDFPPPSLCQAQFRTGVKWFRNQFREKKYQYYLHLKLILFYNFPNFFHLPHYITTNGIAGNQFTSLNVFLFPLPILCAM